MCPWTDENVAIRGWQEPKPVSLGASSAFANSVFAETLQNTTMVNNKNPNQNVCINVSVKNSSFCHFLQTSSIDLCSLRRKPFAYTLTGHSHVCFSSHRKGIALESNRVSNVEVYGGTVYTWLLCGIMILKTALFKIHGQYEQWQ